MKFEEALHKFKQEIAKEYGYTEAIIKIGLDPKLFQAIIMENFKTGINRYGFGVNDIGEYFLEDVQILQRERDRF